MKVFTETLVWLNDNWSAIIVILGLLLGLYKKVKSWLSKSDDEKIKIAKTMLSKTILSYVTSAEEDWLNYKKAGKIKESDVFKQIYKDYPILSKFKDQDSLTADICEMIDLALQDMEEVLENNITDDDKSATE